MSRQENRWLAILGLAFAVAVVTALTAAGPTKPAGAERLLADACQNHQRINSLRLTISGIQHEAEGTFAGTTEIQTDGPRRHIITTTDRGDREEQIVTEDATYRRIGQTESWERAPRVRHNVTAEASGNGYDLFCGYPALTDVTLVGREPIDGRAALRIVGRSDMKQKAAVLWSAELRNSVVSRQFAAGEESFEFWIDEQLRVPLVIRHAASFPQLEHEPPYAFEATLRYSNFNVPVSVAPPKNVVEKPPLRRAQP